MKIARKLTALMLLATLSLPISNLSAKPIVEHEDTFTHENATYIYTTLGNAEYMIDSVNGVRGRGAGVYGLSSKGTVNTSEWKPLLKSEEGDLFTNAVHLTNRQDGYIVISTDDGESYLLGNAYNLPVKADKTNTLGNECYSSEYANDYRIVFTTVLGNESIIFGGSATVSSVQSTHTRTYKGKYDISDLDIKEMQNFAYNTVKSGAYSDKARGGAYLLLENGDVLMTIVYGHNNTTNVTVDVAKPSIKFSGIKDFNIPAYMTQYTDFLTDKGTLFRYDSYNDKKESYTYTKDGTDVTANIYVHSILGSDRKTGATVLDTNLGVFYKASPTATEFTYNAILTELKPVDVGSKHIISQSGHLYKTLNDFDWGNLVKEEFEDWQYNNPIVPSSTLANFDVVSNGIYDREKTFDIKFSLVSLVEPSAFNLYYVKSEDINDKSKWNNIESNISYNELNPVDVELDYTLSDGSKVRSTEYGYTWDTTIGDMTHIQIIEEPIY